MKRILATAIIPLSLLFSSPCTASLAGKEQTRQPVKKPSVNYAVGNSETVFDLAHAEIFSPLKDGPMNYTLFCDVLKQSGEEIGINREPITRAALIGIRTYILAGPVQPLTDDEVSALEEFVENGGNLLVMLHISPPVARLTNAFGIAVSNFVLGETDGVIDGRPQDFRVTNLVDHALTSGLKDIAVYGAWGLMAEGPAFIIASTSGKAWADMDRDRLPGEGEPVQEFGIVAVSATGKGKVVVVSDDAAFANRFINSAGNRRFAENIIRWFRQ